MAANNNLELIPESLCRYGQAGQGMALNPRIAGTQPVGFGIMQNGQFNLALWMTTICIDGCQQFLVWVL